MRKLLSVLFTAFALVFSMNYAMACDTCQHKCHCAHKCHHHCKNCHHCGKKGCKKAHHVKHHTESMKQSTQPAQEEMSH